MRGGRHSLQAAVISDSVRSVAVDERETRTRFHTFGCANVICMDDVTGAVLDDRVSVICHFDGHHDGDGITIAGCTVFRTFS